MRLFVASASIEVAVIPTKVPGSAFSITLLILLLLSEGSDASNSSTSRTRTVTSCVIFAFPTVSVPSVTLIFKA